MREDHPAEWLTLTRVASTLKRPWKWTLASQVCLSSLVQLKGEYAWTTLNLVEEAISTVSQSFRTDINDVPGLVDGAAPLIPRIDARVPRTPLTPPREVNRSFFACASLSFSSRAARSSSSCSLRSRSLCSARALSRAASRSLCSAASCSRRICSSS